MDTDSVFVKPFAPVFLNSFVTHVFGGYNNICNCVFGMSKQSPFLKFALETLKLNYENNSEEYRKRSVPERTGPTFLTAMMVTTLAFKVQKCLNTKTFFRFCMMTPTYS